MSAHKPKVAAVVLFLAGAAAAGIAPVAGCGGGVVSGTAGSSGGGDGGAGSSGSPGSGGSGASAAGGVAGTTSQGGDGGSFVTSSGPGGCASGMSCPSDKYCNDYSDTCNFDGGGTCSPMSPCGGDTPVCACDGKIYPSDCEAYKAGVDVALSGCEAPEGSFLCGVFLCTSNAQTCFHYVGFATYDACEDYPDECDPAQGGTLSCDCFPDYCKCAQQPDNNFVVTCPTGD